MPITFYFTAKLNSDEPLMVTKHLSLSDFYPRTKLFSEDTVETKSTMEEMTVALAREAGFTVNADLPDDKIVTVEWTKQVPVTIKWTEVRMCQRRNKRTSRRCTVRAEIADALEDPMSFVSATKLKERVQDEIKHWMDTDMSEKSINPLILIPLGLRETADGRYEAFGRGLYFIQKYDPYDMVLSDYHDNVINLRLDTDAAKTAVRSNFILFMPSNVDILDEVGEKVV